MSGGRDAARDLIYGRRGGRWAPASTAAAWDGSRMNDMGEEYGDRECRDCGRPYREHVNRCRLCGRDELHHAEGDLDGEVQARARMATARRAAGLPLSELDEWALAEWGDQPLGRVGEAS